MLIKKIIARNFKTYLDLELDLSVTEDNPIILVGGANGGGKTTLFESIYGALYGLKIKNERHFQEIVNANNASNYKTEKIFLELHFSGKVLNQEQRYVLSRTYALNPKYKPVESVKLNMNGNIFKYGTATSYKDRIRAETEVNKIIKANLPEELSHYFLFDAMESGNLLKEDQLNRVIRENIENVMGFNKYLQLSKASQTLYESHTAQRLKIENERKEYLSLTEKKKKLNDKLQRLSNDLNIAYQYTIANKGFYEDSKAGLNQETALKTKVEELEQQTAGTIVREKSYREELDKFVRNMEQYVGLPRLASTLKTEIAHILKVKSELALEEKNQLSEEQLSDIALKISRYLETKHNFTAVTTRELTKYLLKDVENSSLTDPYAFLNDSEVRALSKLVNDSYINPFPQLHQQKIELNISIASIEVNQRRIEDYKKQISGKDYSLLQAYEEKQQEIKRLNQEIEDLKLDIQKTENRLHRFDIQPTDEPDPIYETLKKLQPFFNTAANTLLKTKKQQIEMEMRRDLNQLLIVYQDVIDRVELSEDLKDLTFKIYHTNGNEIFLNQLNTASKQVVVQCLLKALHQYGDYAPPVMIDTVMGVLDEASRAVVLEHYFPTLSHQTILLSSDSEIRTNKDLNKIAPFVAKAYTLKRDKVAQQTSIVEGYFDVQIEDYI